MTRLENGLGATVRRIPMKRLFPLIIVLIMMMPSFVLSQSFEESQKLKAAEEAAAADLVPKGGPVLIPKDVIIRSLEDECQHTFNSNSLLFHYGLATLKQESYPQLYEIAGALKDAAKNPKLSKIRTYYVDGHCCIIGSAEFNCGLSWRRANTIIDELVKLGIPREKLVPKGFSFNYPAHSNETEATRMLNRRVVLRGECSHIGGTDNRTACSLRESRPYAGRERTPDVEATTSVEAVSGLGPDASPVEVKGRLAPKTGDLPPGFSRTGVQPATQERSRAKEEKLPPGFKRNQ